VTLQSLITGCDSLATLNLLVNPTLLSNTDTTVCDSELPFNWNGLSFNAQGMQTATLESLVTGCDSLASLNCIVINNPQIEIIVSSTSGCAPINIEFSNTFANANTTCAWSISNGNTFNTCSSILTFTEAGCFDVSLTSTEQNCVSSLTENNLICLENKPEASFTAAPAVINLSSQWVQFYNSSSYFATNFLWKFGDESSSVEENPQHLYENNTFGYIASLIVSTDQG
jgi:PKD repeat protein